MKTEIETTIHNALSAELPDGIYIIVVYNNQSKMRRKDIIKLYEVFPNENHEIIDSWVKNVKQLLRSNYDVGNAVVDRANTHRELEVDAYEKADKRYNDMYRNFVLSNPGFSKETYEHAVNLGAIAAK
jgi:hypothetical protein